MITESKTTQTLIIQTLINMLFTVSPCFCVFPLQPVPSYGTHTQNNSHSIDVPMTEIHPHKDSMFEVMGDSAGGNRAHTVYYNICQV